MKIDAAIIGGTGIGNRLLELGGHPIHIPTSRGTLRGRLIDHENYRILVLSRHSAGHKVPPHKVNYLGMAEGLSRLKIKNCLASAAVGCLRKEWTPGTFVVCSDFVDFTYRNLTMFEDAVEHTDFTQPFSENCRLAMIQSASDLQITIQPKGTYLAANGPRYETPAEIELYGKLGADLVGMTASSEAIAMREAEVNYGCLAVVTNLAAGLAETELTHEEVVEEMNRAGEYAVQILLAAAVSLCEAG